MIIIIVVEDFSVESTNHPSSKLNTNISVLTILNCIMFAY